jgi:hypothetical protein
MDIVEASGAFMDCNIVGSHVEVVGIGESQQGLLDFPKYKYSGRLSGDRQSLKAIPARIYSVDTISQ